MDYELNRRYFAGQSSLGPAILISMGVFFLLILLSNLAMPWCDIVGTIPFGILGIPLIVFGIILRKKTKQPPISDERYDINVRSNLTTLREQAINALGIDESEVQEIEPIEFDGYSYTGANNIKQGKDGRYRSNKYQSVIIFFSENEAHVYKYTFDTTIDKHSEETEVYFYSDIVSVSTSTDIIETMGKKIESDYFKLTTAGGNALTVSVFEQNGVQQSINAMRALLREKKQQKN